MRKAPNCTWRLISPPGRRGAATSGSSRPRCGSARACQSAVVIDGSVPQALVKYVQDSRADLVAMTTHGRGGVRGAWLGSVADHLVRSLDVPVIVTRAREGAGSLPPPPKIREILVPLDGSPLAEAALTPAAAVAGLFDAELMLVQAVPPLSPRNLFPDTLTAGYDTEIIALERKRAQDYLEGLSEDLRERGTRVKATVVVGHKRGRGAHQPGPPGAR
jgi:nucleotide-binding universal stress UspA family protein